MTDSAPPGPDVGSLRALLEDSPYIDDAGLSDRVARALPPRRRASRLSYAILPAFAALACALAFAVSGQAAASAPPHPALSLAAVAPFFALAFALVLVASASLLGADE